MKSSVDLFGFDELIKNLTEYKNEVKDDASVVIRKTAFKIQANAKQRVAVDTGHTKRNIKVDIDEDGLGATIEVKADDVEYAYELEHGTRYTKAQPFLFPASEEERPEYLRDLNKVMSGKK